MGDAALTEGDAETEISVATDILLEAGHTVDEIRAVLDETGGLWGAGSWFKRVRLLCCERHVAQLWRVADFLHIELTDYAIVAAGPDDSELR